MLSTAVNGSRGVVYTALRQARITRILINRLTRIETVKLRQQNVNIGLMIQTLGGGDL